MGKPTLLALMVAASGLFAQAPPDHRQAAPKELMDYIREAKNSGVADPDILKTAQAAGWSERAVSDALKGTASPHESAPTPKGAATGAAPPAGHTSPPKAPPSSLNNSGATAVDPTAGSPSRNHGVGGDYIIGAGDVVQINVWKEPDASVQSAVVRPEGNISMPLLKEVSVVGLTPAQAEQRIAAQLAKFINAADVTVVVTGINSKKIYVLGAVHKEGPIPYTYRMTIMQALSEAGGITEYAKRKKIYILRNENGRDFRIPFDYDAVLRGERMEMNVHMLAGDTLVVPH